MAILGIDELFYDIAATTLKAVVDLEFLEQIATERRFEPRTLDIAKRILLDGEKPKRLALEYGVNLQRVYAIRKEFMAAAEAAALPPGWERVTLAGPRPVIESLKAQLAEALAEIDATRHLPVQGRRVPEAPPY